MQVAFLEAKNGVIKGDGGPFGAVIVRNGEIVAKGHNMVVKTNDPTAHGEIVAIRKATKKLQRFDLSDCELYTTFEPCPMCLAAVHWAKMKKVYFACTQKDAANIGFADSFIYDVLSGKAKKQQAYLQSLDREYCLPLCDIWKKKKNKTRY